MTPAIVTESLTKLLPKLSLSQPITVDDVKDIIWNEQKSKGSTELLILLTRNIKDQALLAETMRLAQDAWNYFPTECWGGNRQTI